jgi:hypothetical protein
MPAIEYLDDVKGFTDEVLDVDNRPEVRIQGRGRGRRQEPNAPPVVEATMVLTHFERGTDIIRECTVTVGTAPGIETEKVEELRVKLNELIEATKTELKNSGALVKSGRWVR